MLFICSLMLLQNVSEQNVNAIETSQRDKSQTLKRHFGKTDVPKWWGYNDVGRFAHRTYCSGKFFYTLYRHGIFRTTGRYVAAPALWGGVYGVSLIPDLVNNTRAKIPDCKRGERRDIRVRARALGLLVAFHPLWILHTLQCTVYKLRSSRRSGLLKWCFSIRKYVLLCRQKVRKQN